ncbi:MAG: ParM/StbA family protein [Leptolyngbyaceae cyanobacterium]
MTVSLDRAALSVGHTSPKRELATVLTLAGDFGYSTAQLFGTLVRVNQPSYLLPLEVEKLPDTPKQGVFSYVDGDAADMIGRSFAVGSVAHSIDADACRKNADSPENKIDNSLIMLLGLLTYQQGLPTDIEVNLLTCLQKVTAELRAQVTEVYRGRHTISYGGRLMTVSVKPLGVADEGLGVLATTPHAATNKDTVVLSIGGGTVNVSQFKGGNLITQKPFAGGVMRLYEALALAPSLVTKLKVQGDAHIIRDGVERRDFLYGKNATISRFSFEDDYLVELPKWFESTLKRPLQYATPLLTAADAGLVFGGGAMLPGIEALLKKCGYTVVDDPVNANVRGLFEVAKAMVAKGGDRG